MEILTRDYTPAQITAALAPLIGDRRRERIEDVLVKRIRQIQVAVEEPQDIHNGLAIVRTAEALGVESTHIINWKGKRSSGPGTTGGASKWTALTYHQDLEAFKAHPRLSGCRVAAACVDGEMTLDELPLDQPLCVMFGNETDGLTGEAIERSDVTFRIPLVGMTESLNLSVAAAITLHSLVDRRRQLRGDLGDLSKSELSHLRAEYYIRSIGIEKSLAILANPAP